MGEALEAISKLQRASLGMMIGVLFGALAHKWLEQKVGTTLELKDALLIGGVIGAMISRLIEMLLLDPFIKPLLRRRELCMRLIECNELAKFLTRSHLNEVYQKVILSYLIPEGKTAKD